MMGSKLRRITFLSIVVLFSVVFFAFAEEEVEGFKDSEWETMAKPGVFWSIEDDGVLSVTVSAADSDDENASFRLLRPITKGDWTVETRFAIEDQGAGYEVGLMIYTNEDIYHRWGVLSEGKREVKYYSCFMNFDQHKEGQKYSPEVNGPDIKLRIVKIGAKLELQYWDELEQEFITYDWTSYKFPIVKIGVFAKSLGPNNVSLRWDYFRLIR